MIGILAVHYATALLLVTREPFGDWEYLRRSIAGLGPLFAAWAIIYLAGQILIWRSVRRLT